MGCSESYQGPGVCFTNVSRALQNFLSKFVYRKNSTSYENVKLKLCMCAQSHALGTRTRFQLEIPTINGIFGIVYFRKISLESSRNVSETAPRALERERGPSKMLMEGLTVPRNLGININFLLEASKHLLETLQNSHAEKKTKDWSTYWKPMM